MLNLAIYLREIATGEDLIQTNDGVQRTIPRWPSDSDFQLVAFSPGSRVAEVVRSNELAADIAQALQALKLAGAITDPVPDWFRCLAGCACESTGILPHLEASEAFV